MIVDRPVFWLAFLFFAVLIYYASTKTGASLHDRKALVVKMAIVGSFFVGLSVNISLSHLAYSQAASSFEWRRILEFVYIAFLSLIVVYGGKRLLESDYMGEVGYIVLAFGIGTVLRTVIEVI